MGRRPGSTGSVQRGAGRRGRLRFLLGGTAALAVLVAAVFVVFLSPSRPAPASADVVVVLAGADDGRHSFAKDLVEEGVANNFVVSNPGGAREQERSRLCRGAERPVGARSYCLKPDPTTTTGEAQAFHRLAEEERWESAVVVTNRPHRHRVRLNFAQCTEVDTQVVSIDRVVWERAPYHVAREVGGFLKHVLSNPC